MRIAVLQSPGSNCDQDAYHALKDHLGFDAKYVWHRQTSLEGFDGVVIPGGFTYGDYLRGGAIAALSPAIEEVKRFAMEGRPVIGICNGFQILTEAGILPGALVRNAGRRFLCKSANIKAVNRTSPWTANCERVLKIPIAHNEGRYIADDNTIAKLEGEGRVAFVYCTPEGEVIPEAAPSGSSHNIAGILNEGGNVLGMMPHPERAVSELLGGSDGCIILGQLATAKV
ncbi:MAG: phosphoribosylformylglycinamidine synthase subunit PurQ [Fimbriimonadales bacterium]